METPRPWPFVALVLSLAAAAAAQPAEGPAPALLVVPGSHVRLSSSTSGEVKGLVTKIDAAAVHVRTKEGRTLEVPRESASRLAVKAGRRGHALLGAAAGAVVYLLIGAATRDGGCEADPEAICPDATGDALGGALVGAGVGALIRTDRWLPASLAPAAVGPTADRARSARFAISISF
jgi:hypothetical protein